MEFPLNQLKEVALQRVNFPCPNPSNLPGNPCGDSMIRRCIKDGLFLDAAFQGDVHCHFDMSIYIYIYIYMSWPYVPWNFHGRKPALGGNRHPAAPRAPSHGLRVVSITVIYIVEEFHCQHDAGDQ